MTTTTINKNDEIILVAGVGDIFKGTEKFEGSLGLDSPITTKVLSNISDSYYTMRRGDAEVDKAVKQPIPYAMVTVGDKVFRTVRLPKAGESKLHGKGSIGLGGHMNAIEDANDFTHVLHENLLRELTEELQVRDLDGNVVEDLTACIKVDPIGLINNEDEVGQYHICVLYRVSLPDDYSVEVNPNEVDQLKGDLLTVDELRAEYDTLEAWSQISVDLL